MKKVRYVREKKIIKCSQCPFYDETITETEENGKWVACKYKCTNKNKSLGHLRWVYPGHEGTFTNEIPDWCPLLEFIVDDFKILLSIIDDVNKIILDNLDAFNKEFCDDKVFEFLGVSFTSEYANIVYILDCGQTVSDCIEIEKFLKFIEKISCKN